MTFKEYEQALRRYEEYEYPSEAYYIDKEIVETYKDVYSKQMKGECMPDNVNHPSHYTQGGIECIDALEAATVGKTGIEAVCVANVIKYLWRYEEKNGKEDVMKAQWYLNKLINVLNEKETK